VALAVAAAGARAAPGAGAAPPAAGAEPDVNRLGVDVLVYGSEPEAISAAVAAAEEGARVALVTPDQRLGGLFVLGELNVLDLKTQPRDYQLGLFDRWWRRVGRREAFDVERAEAAFEALVVEAGVTVYRAVTDPRPLLVAPGAVAGIEFADVNGNRK